MNDAQMMTLELGAKGYSCAQIVLLGGLRLMGTDNPDLVRAMAGLAQGVGGSGEICGALAGGVCLIALHTGKGHDAEQALKEGPLLMNELVEWFRAECAGGQSITCDALLELKPGLASPAGRSMDSARCGALVAQVWDKALRLLQENGIDPTTSRPEF